MEMGIEVRAAGAEAAVTAEEEEEVTNLRAGEKKEKECVEEKRDVW